MARRALSWDEANLHCMGRYDRITDLADLAGAPTGAPGEPTVLQIADLASGYGRTARHLLARADRDGIAVRVHAVDSASTLDDDVLHDERVRSVIADLDEALPFAEGTLDRVISMNVAEHLADPQAHLAECARVLVPGGLLVLMHSDWDTALFAADDDTLTRTLVDRFVATVPGFAQRADGFMGRKLLDLAVASPLQTVSVQTWADGHRRFDPESVGWKVARGILAATKDDAELAPRAQAWVADLGRRADEGRFLFAVTDVAVVLRRAN